MDLQTLKFFCTVAEEGSLSKAAQKLHYAQSNLSTKITRLEHEMGSPLFFRNNHGVILTPKGAQLLNYSLNLLNLASEAELAMRDDGTKKGILKIGSMESTVVTFLSSFLVSLHQENPEITIQVETGATDYLTQKVLGHKLDGAFVAGPINHPELFSKHVRDEQLVLITSQISQEVSPNQNILQQPLLVFPKGCSYRRILERWISDIGIITGKVYEFNTLNAIFSSAVTGLGITLFPESCVKQYHLSNTLCIQDVPFPYASVPTVFIHRKDSYLSGAMRCFLDSM